MQITLDQAKQYIDDVFRKHGYNNDEVSKIADVIFYAALRGSTQGFPKLFGWNVQKKSRDRSRPVSTFEPVFEKTSTSVGRYDAKRHNAMYVCSLAVDKLIEIAKEIGTGLVGIYNMDNSSGPIGYYTKQIAKNGLVGIMFASASSAIAPANSKKPVLGSNPLSISIPYKNSDITLDMSTAKYTWGDLLAHAASNTPLLPNSAWDSDGHPTTDPHKAMAGSVSSFDSGHKGLGFAFMIQILAGGLVGSIYDQDEEKCEFGNLMIAIDPAKLGGQNFLDQQIEGLIASYKNGNADVHLPGELGDKRSDDARKSGFVEISDEMLKKIEGFLGN